MFEIPAVEERQGVHIIDTQHTGERGTVGCFVLASRQDDSFLMVESGPGSTLDTVLAGIERAGFAPEQLAALLVTHIHLDHAGAAGALLERAPKARLYVHERGAKHMADPSRLLESAKRIYQDDMEYLWGDMLPVPQERIVALSGDEELEILGHRIQVTYTPGHASHQVAYYFNEDVLFTGDAAGAKVPNSNVVRPTLPPPEVNLELYDESLERLASLGARRLMLTHFGEVMHPQKHFAEIAKANHAWAQAVLVGLQAGEDDEALVARLDALNREELAADGASEELIAQHKAISNDVMSVAGIKRYWQKHHPERLLPTASPARG